MSNTQAGDLFRKGRLAEAIAAASELHTVEFA